ncbi:MAG: ribosome biogenesis GTPase Der [Parcubacteria group bacterium]
MKLVPHQYPTAALIGRTNVGKSTIFNCLTDSRKALISTLAGTTRDRRFGECEWDGKKVIVTDTAGIDAHTEELIDIESIKQTRQAMAEADMLLFVVDGKEGLLAADKQLAREIRKTGKPVILIINKVDSDKYFRQISEFYKLGFKEVYPISAKSGSGTGDLCDSIMAEASKHLSSLPDNQTTSEPDNHLPEIKIAIVGKPNVGKSSLLNAILGEQRAIVSSLPHTTRESQDITIEWDLGKKLKKQEIKKLADQNATASNPKPSIYNLTFIDTAGIIKKRKISDSLQKDSIYQSLNSIRKCDIALLVIDASEPITMQDKNISHAITEESKSVIFIVNKWDTIKDKAEKSDKEFRNFLQGNFGFLTWAPIVFTSAINETKPRRMVDLIIEMFEAQHQTITPEQMKAFLHHLVEKRPPQKAGGTKIPFISAIEQISEAPLTFEVFVDDPLNLSFPYRRYISNELRDYFDFMGCGIKLKFTETVKK